jgi:hypothetical protein
LSPRETALMLGRTLAFFAVLSICAELWAQGGIPMSGTGGAAMPFGGGQQPSLTYAGQEMPSNVILLSAGSEAGYDSNVLGGTGSGHTGDEIYSFGPHFSVLHQGLHFMLEVDYQPYFQMYQRVTQYDHVNQTLAFDTKIKLTSQWTLHVRDSFARQTGLYQPELGDTFVTGLGPPTTLNTSIYTPFASERDNNVRFDIGYQGSTRSSISFFGAYGQRDYSGQPSGTQQLLNTQNVSAGWQYTYRLSAHATFGATVMFQRFNSSGALPLGGASRVTTASVLGSLGWHVRPTVTISAWGGPQYSIPEGTVEAGSSVAQSVSNQLGWAAGGTISKQAGRTALLITANRMVSDGGGYLAYARSSTLDFGLRRHLARRWDASLDLMAAQNNSFDIGFGSGNFKTQNAAVGFQHPISDKLSAHITYNFMRESSGGAVQPFGIGFDRSRVTAGVSYQLKGIPIGR